MNDLTNDMTLEGWGLVGFEWHYFAAEQELSLCKWWVRGEAANMLVRTTIPRKSHRCEVCYKRAKEGDVHAIG